MAIKKDDYHSGFDVTIHIPSGIMGTGDPLKDTDKALKKAIKVFRARQADIEKQIADSIRRQLLGN